MNKPVARRICFVTGARADYGHLASVIAAVDARTDLTLQLVVTGQHLDPRYGETWHSVVDDGYTIDAKVDIGLQTDTPLDTAQAVGRGVSTLALSFDQLKPDIIVVLGDRFEIFAAAQAALLLNIPLAHIHGGEATEAAVDDAIRHAITKMARLHFCAAEPYAARVRQMGEDPGHVYAFGAPGLDPLATLDFVDRQTLALDLSLDLTAPLFVITYHPVTLQLGDGMAAVEALTDALAKFSDAAMIFTGVNSDPGNRIVSDTLGAFAAAQPDRRTVIASLGQRRYLSAVKLADVVIGNSSSGLIEAPALGVPTVNIGDRQKGRLRSASVIDCPDNSLAIAEAVARAMSAEFQTAAQQAEPAYGRGGVADQMAEVLARVDLTRLSTKPFHDIIDA